MAKYETYNPIDGRMNRMNIMLMEIDRRYIFEHDHGSTFVR